MPRRPRADLPDGVFHVTTRGVAEAPIYLDDEDRARFVRLLHNVMRRHSWICHAYCLMTTHYHLLLETKRADLSPGMRELNGLYARGFNDRYDRKGHVFGERYAAFVVDSVAHFAEARRYVLDDPVRAGLCSSAEQWPWSGLDTLRTWVPPSSRPSWPSSVAVVPQSAS
jgi:REP-associated tyrosine transposase